MLLTLSGPASILRPVDRVGMRPTPVPRKVRQLAALDPEYGYPLHTTGDIPAQAQRTPGYQSRQNMILWTVVAVMVVMMLTTRRSGV